MHKKKTLTNNLVFQKDVSTKAGVNTFCIVGLFLFWFEGYRKCI